MKTFLLLVFLIFAVFGLSEFLHILKLFIIFPKRRLYSHLVVNLQNKTAEKQLLYICEQYKWHGKSFADFIVLGVGELDTQTYNKCKSIANRYGIEIPTNI